MLTVCERVCAATVVKHPLIAAVAVTMALTPLLMIINEKFIQPRFGTLESVDREIVSLGGNDVSTEKGIQISDFDVYWDARLAVRKCIVNGVMVGVLYCT